MSKPNSLGAVPLTPSGVGGVALPVTVPEGALFAVFWTSLYGGSPNALESLASTFAGAWTIVQMPHTSSPSIQLGVALAYADVTSTGAGKTITPAYTIDNYLGPTVFVEFFDEVVAVRDTTFIQAPFGAPPSGDIDSRVTDFVSRFDVHYGATAPDLASGWTTPSGGTQLARSELSARLSAVTSAGVTATDVSGTSPNYNSVGAISLIGPGDEPIPPVLTLPTGVKTSSVSATGSVTTDKAAGTLYYYASTNATETAATIKASGASQAVSASGLQNVVIASGLTPATTYYLHYVHGTLDGDSNVVSSGAFTTDAPDTTAPTLTSGVGTVKSNAMIVVGATTDEANGTMYAVLTTSAMPPSAAQIRSGLDDTGAPAAWADSQAIGSTGAKAFNATGLDALTTYYPYIVHRDASDNDSAVLWLSACTTFRDGATGQYILDNTGPIGGAPGGILFNDVDEGDEDKWFSFRITTSPSSGTLNIQPDGRFTFEGAVSTFFEYQLEVDGIDVGSPVRVDLYDEGLSATPANSNGGATVSSSSANQSQVAASEGAVSGATVSPSTALQTFRAAPANANSGASVGLSFATQDAQALPADSISGATVGSSQALATSIVVPANSVGGAIVWPASAVQSHLAVPAFSNSSATVSASTVTQLHQAQALDSVGCATVRSTRALQLSREPSLDTAFYPVPPRRRRSFMQD